MDRTKSSGTTAGIFDKHGKYLHQNLDPSKILYYLRCEEVLDEDMEEVEAGKTVTKRSKRLVTILKRRGPDAFTKLIEALKDSGVQAYLVDHLDPEG